MLKVQYEDGNVTHACTASYVLLHWQSYILPEEKLPENPPILEVVIGRPVPAPYDEKFLTLIIGGIERNYGTAPSVSEELLTKEWYENLPTIKDHNSIVFFLKNKNEKIIEYEQACWSIIFWLFQNGNIVSLDKTRK